MRNLTVPEIDQFTDPWVGAFAILIGIGAYLTQRWVVAGCCFVVAGAVVMVIIWRRRAQKRAASVITDWTDSDRHLADVAIANTERPA